MSVLSFESEESLRFAITSGLVPEAVLFAAARTWRDERTVFVAPSAPVPAEPMKRLAKAGVGRHPDGAAPANAIEVRSWAEIVSVEKSAIDGDLGPVLFVLRGGAGACDLAGELIRLGCDRLELREVVVPGGGKGGESTLHLLRANAPPFYSLLRAIDGHQGVRAFVPSPRGQDRVWVEIGHDHPLARFLRPDPGSVLLLTARGTFDALPDGPFTDMYSFVDLRVPGDPKARAHAVPEETPRLIVNLRLARRASSGAPSLWVIRTDAVAKVERLLASLPEDATRGLLFAAADTPDGTLVVLRARAGVKAPPLEIDEEAYLPHASIANLFMPCDATLEPPLRRDKVQTLLAPEADDVVWLARSPGAPERFVPERMKDAAFRPLGDWVDYVVDLDAKVLSAWAKSATFEFDAFVGEDLVASAAAKAAPEAKGKKTRRDAPDAAEAAPRIVTTTARAVPANQPRRVTVQLEETAQVPAAELLATLQKEFFALDTPADDPERVGLWGRMAPLAAELGSNRDAASCWARVLWETEGDAATETALLWSQAEARPMRGATLQTLLALDPPAPEHVRAVAASLAAAPRETNAPIAHDATLWLERHDHMLDVRAAWLARVALSRAVGGDRLGLARARDRLLSRIQRGLSLERDVPSFLRHGAGGRDVAEVEQLADRLRALEAALTQTKRKRSATEADPKLTQAYVRFVVAYGAARLGRSAWARELSRAATGALPAADPIHGFLSRAYAARVNQALEGLPPETPLPADLSRELNDLGKLDRYKVDRVRQCSKVLEPHERLDPITAFQRGEADPRGPEFAPLRGVSDPAVIAEAAIAIMSKAKASPPEDRARLYDGVMDFFPMLPLDRARGHIEEVLGGVSDVAPRRRVELLEEALMLAGHFNDANLATKIFAVIEPLVASIGPEGAGDVAPLAFGMLRTLRRAGLKGEASRLLTALGSAASGQGTPQLIARVYIAAGLSYVGQNEASQTIFEEALTTLNGELGTPDRLRVTRAVARALGSAPVSYALAALGQLGKRLDVVTDSFNTNSHVCLSVLDFMEALVLGYASDELAMTPAAKRWLDDDEHLVRRRIHRDLTT